MSEIEELVGEAGVLGLEDDLEDENGEVDPDQDRDDPGLASEGAVCSEGDEHRGWYTLVGL